MSTKCFYVRVVSNFNYCLERSEGLYMFMNLNDILDHVAMSGFWISCTYWTLKGFWISCIYWTGTRVFCICRTFKGTPDFLYKLNF
ncbi:unnamed protein product [Rhizophagus irregularis]|nr:unnamed protein product [Rhizophagus irregularis]